MSYIEFKNVKKIYKMGDVKIRALNGVDFKIDKGEFAVVLGPSGAGKSTILNVLGGMDTCTTGEITVDGKRIDKYNSRQLTAYRRYDIGFVFQFYNLVQNLTVKENVELATQICKAPLDIVKTIEAVGLSDRMGNFPSQLSGGEQQRVAIARALASDPKILLCDEATSALDPQTTSSILELLKKINRQFGITIVIITHQMSVVREICTHVAIMYEGEVVEKGLVADIFANPQSEVAKELIRKDTGSDIGADSRPDACREKGQAEIKSGEKIRIVFSENSAFEPVIANLILTFGEPVNILKADTKNVGGVAKGEMILEFMEGSTRTEMMKQYLKEKGLAIGEVTEYVGS